MGSGTAGRGEGSHRRDEALGTDRGSHTPSDKRGRKCFFLCLLACSITYVKQGKEHVFLFDHRQKPDPGTSWLSHPKHIQACQLTVHYNLWEKCAVLLRTVILNMEGTPQVFKRKCAFTFFFHSSRLLLSLLPVPEMPLSQWNTPWITTLAHHCSSPVKTLKIHSESRPKNSQEQRSSPFTPKSDHFWGVNDFINHCDRCFLSVIAWEKGKQKQKQKRQCLNAMQFSHLLFQPSFQVSTKTTKASTVKIDNTNSAQISGRNLQPSGSRESFRKWDAIIGKDCTWIS